MLCSLNKADALLINHPSTNSQLQTITPEVGGLPKGGSSLAAVACQLQHLSVPLHGSS